MSNKALFYLCETVAVAFIFGLGWISAHYGVHVTLAALSK